MYFRSMCLHLLLLSERKVSQVYVLRFVKTDDLNPKIENCFKQMLLPLTMRILLQRRLITY